MTGLSFRSRCIVVGVGVLVGGVGVGCASAPDPGYTASPMQSASSPVVTASPVPTQMSEPTTPQTATAAATPTPTSKPTVTPTPTPTSPDVTIANPYPWHHNIVATTFWVGEIFDPNAEDGSQEISTYDGQWLAHYGGCDGIVVGDGCETEKRSAKNDYFPTSMTPKENPFYLDLPFDDINNAGAFARRATVIPWASLSKYANDVGDGAISLMKNRWVEIRNGDNTCFGQIEDAGPGEYNDATYVFGTGDARPLNSRYGGAGMDVSPALNGCLGFTELDGDTDSVTWRFVDDSNVPVGPWTEVITTSPVSQ